MSRSRDKAERARSAARILLRSSDDARRRALEALADRVATADDVDGANGQDLAAATGLAPALLERLKIDAGKRQTLADGCRQIAAMPDPLGKTLRSTILDDDLHLYQVTCPLGVVACIFESRPDVVVQIAALAIRTGNAVLLKGGSEAAHTNAALAEVVQAALADADLPTDAVQLLDGREEVQDLLALDDLVDLIIPRGGNELVRHIQSNTHIPVLGHAAGICHVYIDAAADLSKALHIAVDSKLDYPAACNAVETILVHEAHRDWVPELVETLTKRGSSVHQGGAADFNVEYGSPSVNVGIVASIDEALEHIARFGSAHTDAIVTEDPAAARTFVAGVDSAGVFVNASTRFADGYRYGLGAEVGISTNRIHARGPVGLEGLVSYRWILVGDGHVAATYRDRPFRHEASQAPFTEQWEAWNG